MKRIISIFLMIALLAPYVAVETSKAETKESQTEWNIQRIRAEQSYEDSKKAEKIRVALLDSGVDLDDDIECEEQEDFIDNTGEETNFLMGDSNGHGTAVAGIICARKSEDRICGMAANVELYSAKILDEQNEAPVERVVKAIQWAIEKKVNIIHMSFATTEYSPELKKAVEDARQAGILLIAPAGNAGSADEDESSVMYPAAWDSVISVGSTDDMNEKSAFSPTGEGLDIMAPGEKILSTGAFGGIIVEEGTSLAAAQVTGAASVLWGLHRDKGADFIRKLLVQSANQTLGDKENFGEGLLDYEQAKNNYEKLDVKNWKTEEIYGSNDEVCSGTKCHYVTGQWKGKRHSSQFINANNSKKSVSDNDIKLIKIAVCAPDSISRMKSYSLHPCFHGGKNYVANTEYILYSAYKLGEKENKVRYQDVFPNNVDLYKNEKGKEDVQKELGQATKQQLFKYCKKKAGKKKALTAKQKSLILLGVAIHNATDAVSHRAYKKVSFNIKIKGNDKKEVTKKYNEFGPIVHSSEDVTNPNVKAKAVDTVWGNLKDNPNAYIDNVLLDYGYLKEKLAIADIVKKTADNLIKDTINTQVSKNFQRFVDDYIATKKIKVGGSYWDNEPEQEYTVEQYIKQQLKEKLVSSQLKVKKKGRSGSYSDDYESVTFEDYISRQFDPNEMIKKELDAFMDDIRKQVNTTMKETFDNSTKSMLSNAVLSILSANDTYRQIENNIKCIADKQA